MKYTVGSLLAIAVLALCVRAENISAPHYVFSSAGNYPGAFQTLPNGANLSLIVGYFIPTTGNTHAYIQSGLPFFDGSVPGFLVAEPTNSFSSYLFSVNTQGIAAGGYCRVGTRCNGGELFAAHGYTYAYSSRVVTVIDYPGSMSTAVYGINDEGTVVGGFCPTLVQCPIGLALTADHGFIDDAGVFTQLDFPGASETTAFGINSSGTVVGIYANDVVQHSFIYENGVYTDVNFPGANWTDATAINDLGVIVGYYQDANFNVNGFMYYQGQWAQINVQPGNTTAVIGINRHNDLVGTWNGPTGLLETFQAVPTK